MPFAITPPAIVLDDQAPTKFTAWSRPDGDIGLRSTVTATDRSLHTTPDFLMSEVAASLPPDQQMAFAAATQVVFGAVQGYTMALLGAVPQ